MSEDLRTELTKYIDLQIESLGNDLRPEEKPFYMNISTVIAICAFMVSFGTTLFSYIRTVDQDRHALRAELALTLQKISALPKENIETYFKYKDQGMYYSLLSGFINQENLILSKQADDLIRRLPASEVSSTDLDTVALSLQNSRNFDAALGDFEKALKNASSLDDEMAAMRNLASLEMTLGRIQEGRGNFQKAREIFASNYSYSHYDDSTKNFTNFQTELAWAWAEANIGSYDIAANHTSVATDIMLRFPSGDGTNMLKNQIDQLNTMISTAKQGGRPLVSLPQTSQMPVSVPMSAQPPATLQTLPSR